MTHDPASAPPIQSDVSLRTLNTFGVEARAAYFVTVHSEAEIRALTGDPIWRRGPRFVLGGGSNVLFTRDVPGLVVHNAIGGITVVGEDAEHVLVRAGAGVVWHDLVVFAVSRGLGGIENLALIPGRVGAAPMQNIGAYGVELESTCESVETVDIETGAGRTFARDDCAFGYRDSVFKHAARDRHLITALTLRLARHPRLVTHYGDVAATLEAMGAVRPTVRDVMAAVVRIRTAKLPDPAVLGNAGSFFKNPVLSPDEWRRMHAAHPDVPHYPQPGGGAKVPAAWLIEQCGFKGRTQGRAGVHDRQALVLVNRGGATGGEILALAAAVQAAVRDRFGVALVPEVQIA